MKPNTFFHYLAAGLLLSGLAAGVATAQNKQESPSAAVPAPARTYGPTVGARQQTRLNIDFGENTTLKDAVENLKGRFRTAGEAVNILIRGPGGGDADAGKIRVPVMSLQNVTFEQALQSIALATTPRLNVQATDQLAVLQIPSAAEQKKMIVFNISAYLGSTDSQTKEQVERSKTRLEDLRRAVAKGVEIAGRLNPEMEAPGIEVEDRTGLLFVTGSGESLDVVSEIVHALCDPPGAPASQAKP
jgi:hypothetical protein